MSKLSKLEIIYNGTNLLPPDTACIHKIESVFSSGIVRLTNGEACLQSNKILKHKINIKGSGQIPDIFYLPSNALLQIKTGARFCAPTNQMPKYVISKSLQKQVDYINYRIQIDMIIQNFCAEYNELTGKSAWELVLEEL